MKVRVKGKPIMDEKLSKSVILWRYLDSAKFFDFVLNRTLFFCRGDQFQDKFEGSFTTPVKNAIQKSYHINKIDFSYEKFKKRLRERVFLNCWHNSRDDSMAMWLLYGKANCSVAITTTVGKLTNEFNRVKLPYFISIKKVEYVRHWEGPELNIKPYSNVFAYKAKAYDFEKEVRIIIDRFDDEFNNEIEDRGLAISIDPNNVLRSIVVSPEAPEWFVKLVRLMTEKNNITTPVRRSKLALEPI